MSTSYNPLTPTAVSKPLEMIGSPTYVLTCQEPTAPDSDITRLLVVQVCDKIDACMPHCVCCMQASSNAAKSGEFLGEFSLVEFDPMGIRGLKWIQTNYSWVFVQIKMAESNKSWLVLLNDFAGSTTLHGIRFFFEPEMGTRVLGLGLESRSCWTRTRTRVLHIWTRTRTRDMRTRIRLGLGPSGLDRTRQTAQIRIDSRLLIT